MGIHHHQLISYDDYSIYIFLFMIVTSSISSFTPHVFSFHSRIAVASPHVSLTFCNYVCLSVLHPLLTLSTAFWFPALLIHFFPSFFLSINIVTKQYRYPFHPCHHLTSFPSNPPFALILLCPPPFHLIPPQSNPHLTHACVHYVCPRNCYHSNPMASSVLSTSLSARMHLSAC